MHRIHNRCTTPEERNHHLNFMLNVLRCRDQDMKVVHEKFENFMSKSATKIKHKRPKWSSTVLIKYDAVSESHNFSKNCILAAIDSIDYEKPSIVYTSQQKLIVGISSKRDILGKVKRSLDIK